MLPIVYTLPSTECYRLSLNSHNPDLTGCIYVAIN